MVSVPEKGEIKKRLLALWIIWAQVFALLVVFVFICHQGGYPIRQMGDEIRQFAFPNFPLDLMKNILYGISILTLILTHFLRKSIFAGRFGGSGPMSSKPSSPSNQPTFFGKYAIAMMVSLALSASIGIYGFILFMLGDDFRTLYIFIGISALAMFFYRPKMEELETLAIAMQTKEAPAPEL